MKKTIICICMSVLIIPSMLAQDRSVPNVKIKTLDGKSINIQTIENDGNPIVISFWATWCKPCKKELNTIAEYYDDWKEETGMKLVAISIDDSRSMSKVAPYINSSDWDYEVYLDPNRELARALSVSTVPHTFLLNKDGEIVWEHRGYIDGDEQILYKQILKISK